MPAPIPANEIQRLDALHALGILHTPPDAGFDDIAQLAAALCATPIAAVSFVDATSQWFKARLGLPMCSTERGDAFCAHAILEPHRPLIVPDAALDPKFSGSPLVMGEPRIRFYAGVPLVTPDGFAIGSLCVKDVVPRELTPRQLTGLACLARQAMQLVEARRSATELSELKATLGHHGIVVTADPRGQITSLSGQLSDLFHADPAPAADALQPGPGRTIFAEAWPTITGGKIWRGEVALAACDGRRIWIQATVVPTRDNTGRIWQYIAIGTDVTAARHMREAAQRQNAELQALFDLMPAMIWFKDTGNRVLRVNRRAADATGRPIAEIEGRHSWEIYPQDADRYFADDLEVIRSGEPKLGILETVHDQAGRALWTRTDKVPYRDQAGQVVGVVVVARDVTQQRRDEEMLRLLGSAVHYAKDSIMITDARVSSPGPRILFVNAAFASLTGYGAEQAIGQSPRFLQGPRTDPATLQRIARALREGSPIRGETINYHRDGRLLDLEWQVAPIRESGGQLTHFVVVLRDISERKAAERELSLAREAAIESSRLKSRFLANMSHELRTPLNAINGLSAMLLEQGLPTATHHAVKLILQSGETLLENIQTILTHSSLEAGKVALDRKPFAIAEVVVHALRLAAPRAQSKNLDLDYRIDLRTPAKLAGDPFRLQQVLVNLIANAVKFTDRGRVFVRVRAHPLGAGRCELRFAVADTGIGIAADKLSTLFQPFSQADDSTTRRFEGTGLGLAIAKSLVELMEGKITCCSRPQVGSLFRFRVVLSVAEAAPSLVSATAQASLVGQPVSLDEPDLLRRRELARYVAAWGMRLVAASTPAPGFRIRRHHAGDESLELPDPASPTVWLCQANQPPARVAGAHAILYEPFEPSDLSRALAGLLPQASSRVAERDGRPSKIADRIPLRILAADDIPSNREGLRLICQHLGYAADFAENGAEALARLREKPYDLILLDVQMPVLDGLAAAEEICRRYPDTHRRPRLVAVTACAQPSDRDRCLEAGMDDYLSKPVVPKALVACIERLFRPSTSAAGTAAPHPEFPPPSVASPLIDREHLRAFTEGMSDEEAASLVHTLQASVQTDFTAALGRIATAAAARDGAALAAVVHGVKGSVHSLGCKAMAEQCAAILSDLRAGTFAGWSEVPGRLQSLFVASAAELERVFPLG